MLRLAATDACCLWTDHFCKRLLQYERKWNIDEKQLNTLLAKQEWKKAEELLAEHPAAQLLEAKDAQGKFMGLLLPWQPPTSHLLALTSSLNLVANLSTMLGLLGTVYGLILLWKDLTKPQVWSEQLVCQRVSLLPCLPPPGVYWLVFRQCLLIILL